MNTRDGSRGRIVSGGGKGRHLDKENSGSGQLPRSTGIYPPILIQQYYLRTCLSDFKSSAFGMVVLRRIELSHLTDLIDYRVKIKNGNYRV